jgi:hypothetical protein
MSIFRASRARACIAAAAALVAAGGASGQGVGDVLAAPLADVDPFVVGALAPRDGGLPDTLWAGSDLEGVADAASRAPGESGFLAASEMTARALMSAGASPSPPGDRRGAAIARVSALLDLGRIDAVDAIVTQTASGLDDPELAALAVQARLAKGEVAAACRAGDELGNGRDGAFWLRLRAACYAWAGETAAAQLTLDLAREADAEVAGEDFTTWVFAAASGEAPRRAPAPRDVLEAALALSTDYVFDAETLEPMPLFVAVGVMRDRDVAPEVRALAARRAARVGAASAEDFVATLDALPGPPDASLEEQLAVTQEEGFPAADALLLRVASAEGAGLFDIADALDTLLTRAETPADFIVTSRALADVIEALPPSPDLLPIAPQLVLAAAAVGDRRLAYEWLNPEAGGFAAPTAFAASFSREGLTPILNSRPDFSRSPIEPVARIAAEAVVAASDPTASPQWLASVALARLDSTLGAGEAEEAEARRDALILLALGAEVSPELRRAASAAAAEAPAAGDVAPQALAEARLAADAGALGETALYLAQATAEVGPSHAPTIARAIEIARAAGLERDARALAVEAMLATRVSAAEVGE